MRHFDKSYLLLVFPVARMCLPWLQFRTKAILVVPFIVLWFINMLIKPSTHHVRGEQKARFWFFIAFASMVLYMWLPAIYGIDDPRRSNFSLYNFLSNFIMNLSFFIVLYLSMMRGKFKELRFLGFVLMGIMLYNGFASMLVGAQIGSGSARVLLGAANGIMDADFMYDAQIIVDAGMAGYDYMYIYAFLAPCFLYAAWTVKRKWIRMLFLTTAFANVMCIKNGGLQTPFVVLFIGCVLITLAICFRLRKTIVLCGIMASMLLLIYIDHPKIFSPLAAPLVYLSDHAERGVYKGRLMSMAEAVSGDENTYAFSRYQLQKRSLKSFWDGNWLIGEGIHADEGGHSMLCDNLAFYGLFGLSIIILFLVAYVRFFEWQGRMFLGTKWLTMVYCYIGALSFAMIANPVNLCYGQMYIVLPILALYFPDCKVIEERTQWSRLR